MRAIRLSDNAGDVYYCAADIGGDYDCQLPSKYHYRVDLESNAIVSLPIKLKAASSQVPLKAEIRTYAPADVAEGLSVSAVAWIRSNTPESDGRKRWSALSGIAHDTRVIGFGENSHGIADWRIAGLELFQFLVEKHRFNFIALEADFATSIAVNDYVTRGIGNPEELLNELSDWIWNTRETLALIHWMRAYNVGRKPGSQLQIVGVDMQYTQHAVSCARRYLQSVGTRNFQDFDTILGLLTNDDDSAYLSGIDVSAQARALRFVRQLKIRFDAEKTRYERLTGEHKFLVARHCLVVLDQYMRMTGSRDRADARDFWMAENVRWLLDEFDSKSRILFIAHDFHVAKTPNGWSVPAGWHLSSALGNKYFSIGTFFYKGSLRAWDAQQPAVLRSIPSTATADSFMEASLHSVGHPGFLLDFASAKSHPELKSWLRIPHFARIVSADYSSNEASKTLLILEQTFDALLFVDNVHSTTKIER